MAITKLNSQAIPADAVQSSDLDYPLTDFSSTGIDDNATTTLITLENAGIAIGTSVNLSQDLTVDGNQIILDSGQVGGSYMPDKIEMDWQGIRAKDGSGTVFSSITFSEASNPLDFDKAAITGSLTVDTDTLVVDSTNNRVGIGTSSPSEALTVSGSGTSARISLTDSDSVRASMTGLLEFDGTDNRAGFIGYEAGDMSLYAAVGDIKLSTAGAARLTIDETTGFVGIGVSPVSGAPLTVKTSNSAFAVGEVGGEVLVGPTSTLKALKFGNQVQSGTNTWMTIDSTGNVGIGTTDPSSPNGFSRNLTISGASCSLALDETDFNTWEMIVSSGSFRIYDETNERFRITSAGYVGINVSDPDAPLEIYSGVVDDEVVNIRGYNADRGLNIRILNASSITDKVVEFNNELSNGTFSFAFNKTRKLGFDANTMDWGQGNSAPTLKLNSAASSAATLTYAQAGVTRYIQQMFSSGNGFYWGAYDSAGANFKNAGTYTYGTAGANDSTWSFRAGTFSVKNAQDTATHLTVDSSGDTRAYNNLRAKSLTIGNNLKKNIVASSTGVSTTAGATQYIKIGTIRAGVSVVEIVNFGNSGYNGARLEFAMDFNTAVGNDHPSVHLKRLVASDSFGELEAIYAEHDSNDSANIWIKVTTPASAGQTYYFAIDNLGVDADPVDIDGTIQSTSPGLTALVPDMKQVSSSPEVEISRLLKIRSPNNNSGQLNFVNTSVSNGFTVGLRGDTSGDGLIYHGDAKNIQFWTSADEKMVLTSAGHLRLGTSGSDTSKLAINSASNGAVLHAHWPTSIGGTYGNTIEMQQLTNYANTNLDYLRTYHIRDGSGSGWGGTGYRIQRQVDSTHMAWMQFGGNGNPNGISWGTGSNGTSRMNVATSMTLNSSGNLELPRVGLNFANWGAGSDIDGLISGSTFGSLIEGQSSGHITIGIRGNDNADHFMVVSGAGNYTTDSTYDRLCFAVSAVGNATLYGTLSEGSSIRFKTNVQDLNESIISSLRPVRYEKDGASEVGLISEEVEEVDSTLVTYDKNGLTNGVLYTRMVPHLIKSLQDQQAIIESLEARIAQLEAN